MHYIAALISVILGAIAQYLFKIVVSSIFNNSKGILNIVKKGITNVYLLIGILCYGFSFILWFYVLSKMELSKAYPLVSVGYVFTLFLGYVFLNEEITFFKVVGVVIIIFGVVVLTR